MVETTGAGVGLFEVVDGVEDEADGIAVEFGDLVDCELGVVVGVA